MTVSDLTEQELVGRIRSRLAPAPSWMLVGIGDDAAVVEAVRNQVEVLTVDALVEGVHFDRRFSPPAAIGHRALAVNLSDLAAMGATPRLALLSLALPSDLPCEDFDAIVDGFTALAAAHHTQIAGGNLTRSPGPLVLDVTAIGWVKRRGVLTRAGARPGDGVYVTGSVGGALAGLQVLQSTVNSDLVSGLPPAPKASARLAEAPFGREGGSRTVIDKYLYPQPRVRTGVLLGRNRAATACMDLSDGLADGIRQIAEASGVGATIDRAAIPIEPAARSWFETRGADAVAEALGGGDDYELVFTASPKMRGRLRAVARHGGVTITRIGSCTKESAVQLTGETDGQASTAPLPRGFSHFR